MTDLEAMIVNAGWTIAENDWAVKYIAVAELRRCLVFFGEEDIELGVEACNILGYKKGDLAWGSLVVEWEDAEDLFARMRATAIKEWEDAKRLLERCCGPAQ